MAAHASAHGAEIANPFAGFSAAGPFVSRDGQADIEQDAPAPFVDGADVLGAYASPSPAEIVELTEAQAAAVPSLPPPVDWQAKSAEAAGTTVKSATPASSSSSSLTFPSATAGGGSSVGLEGFEGGSTDPRSVGEQTLRWMLFPVTPAEFFDKFWEQRPLLIRRSALKPSYHEGLLDVESIKSLIAEGKLAFEKDLDVTAYTDGKRTTHNGTGEATLANSWEPFANQGRSLRMLAPHAHMPQVYRLLSALEDAFGCFTGSNSYLTPAATQGFAPHYDDIEAFLLQTVGVKHWRVYRPLAPSRVLPRFSSKNLSQEALGSPVLEADLRPGDLLYLPRGWVHQAVALPDSASLHLTVSTAMRYTWQDLVGLALQAAVAAGAEANPELRRTLPRELFDHAGVMRADEDAEAHPVRGPLFGRAHRLINECVSLVDLDGAADQITRQFLRQRLPPLVDTETEALQAAEVDVEALAEVELAPGSVLAARSAHPASAAVASSSSLSAAADTSAQTAVGPATVVRLTHPRGTRMTVEAGECVVYHAHANSIRFEGAEEGRLVFDLAVAPAVEEVIRAYPGWVAVSELPVMLEEDDDEGDDQDDDVSAGGDAKAAETLVLGVVEELVREGAFVMRQLA